MMEAAMVGAMVVSSAAWRVAVLAVVLMMVEMREMAMSADAREARQVALRAAVLVVVSMVVEVMEAAMVEAMVLCREACKAAALVAELAEGAMAIAKRGWRAVPVVVPMVTEQTGATMVAIGVAWLAVWRLAVP